MIDATLRAFVRERARRRCEYCRLHESDAEYLAFHVEHVIAKKHGGTDNPEMLCYACSECNFANGSNIAGILRGNLYPLFNPRTQNWTRHFEWEQTTLIGKTATGMVTSQVLNINKSSRLMLRENLLFEARFPLDD